MASRITEIKQIANAIISSVSGEGVSYEEVLSWELEPTAYPASTILFSYANQTDWATSGITLNEWRFIQRTLTDNTDPEQAQREMEILIPAFYAALRHAAVEGLALQDGTMLELDVEDAGDPGPAYTVSGTPVYEKPTYLIARTEEF